MDEPTMDAPVQEGATVDTPQGTDTQTPEVNWQERYQQLQPEYTRATQQLSRFEKDEEFQQQYFRQLAEKFGYEIEDPTPEAPVEDDFEFADPVARQQLQQLQQQLQESQQAQEFARMEQHVDSQFKQLGIDNSDDQELLLLIATKPGAPSTQDGMPDIKAALDTLTKRDEQAQQRWAQSKRAPRIAPGGRTATQVPDLSDPQARVDWMAQQWAAAAED